MRIFKNLFPRLNFKIHDVFIKNIFIMGLFPIFPHI